MKRFSDHLRKYRRMHTDCNVSFKRVLLHMLISIKKHNTIETKNTLLHLLPLIIRMHNDEKDEILEAMCSSIYSPIFEHIITYIYKHSNRSFDIIQTCIENNHISIARHLMIFTDWPSVSDKDLWFLLTCDEFDDFMWTSNKKYIPYIILKYGLNHLERKMNLDVITFFNTFSIHGNHDYKYYLLEGRNESQMFDQLINILNHQNVEPYIDMNIILDDIDKQYDPNNEHIKFLINKINKIGFFNLGYLLDSK